MKKLIAIAVLMMSQAAFSQVLPKEEGAQVLRAIKESVTYNDLNCLETISGREMKASSLSWSFFNDSEVTIKESEQPVIIIKKTSQTHETIAKFVTNAEFTIVTGFTSVTSELKRETRNTGTIIRPRYEEVISRKATENLTCR